MKIAVISMIREPWGGSEELWASMASEALSEGHTVIHSTFIFDRNSPKEEMLIKEGMIHIGRTGFFKPGLPVPVRILRKFLLRIRNIFSNPFAAVFAFNPDLVIYNGTCYSIVGETHLLQILRKKNTPYVIIGQLSSEDGKEITDREAVALREIYREAKKVFFVSKRGYQNACKRIDRPIPNGQVIRNPVNITSFDTEPFPTSATAQLAMVGLLRIVHKGQDIALKALAGEAWKNRDWHLNIYGSGEDESLLRRLVQDLNLQNRVSFHGRVQDIRRLWADNQLLLMPSLMEGMPLAVVEAMICGRPAVVSDVGGHKEWIEEGVHGWIAGTPADFASALEKAWMQRAEWEEMGLQAHRRAMLLCDPAPGKTLLMLLKNIIPAQDR
ncbi:MAG: glycosyltransferase family 4 protein [Sphingobacteriales bacterium]|nr:glycosyltransferase family 4 protein [Sphingobacteriales bacterium]NCT73690.1 glycosyltransferase family 4 protein [Chitinophagaceae bacterium]OJW34877.1 MAG: hypothetical protein BGO54_06200 [Sphingobacteriales bacterium 46-32]